LTRENYIKQLISEKGFSVKTFSEKIEIPYSTLRSMLNGSIGGAAVDSVIKICAGLGISINDLQSCNTVKLPFETSDKEKKLIIAYRNNPEMQPAVDKLLGLTDEVLISTVKAARSDGNNQPIEIVNLPDLSKFEPDDTDL
jgi:repressor LexA